MHPPEKIEATDAEIAFIKAFIDPQEAHRLYAKLYQETPWQHDKIRMMGKWIDIPRLQAWVGDPHCQYRYSGLQLTLNPWSNTLQALRTSISEITGVDLNCVLLNLYRDGQDSMGWHADDEDELGQNPTIASLSLGATRRFHLKHRQLDERLSIELSHGSLLIMSGRTQHHWLHQVPKTKRKVEPRINLTFRQIRADSS